jgi:tRNA-specific 2-thiouridylase
MMTLEPNFESTTFANTAFANTTIAIAMSGGVDSSAVAGLLRSQGHNVVGLTLQLWNQRRLAGHEGMPEAVQGRCCSIDDVYDARRVAEQLDIPYYLVNQQERFEQDVVKPFVAEYLAGRTPIPCTLCNNHLKFDQLLITARQIGAERIATGHYARNEWCEERQRWILKRPSDQAKDQTYFLFGLTQEQLSRTLFPLGEMQKPAVREMAAAQGMPARLAQKPDSQEICFIPSGDYKAFIDAYLDEQGEAVPVTAGVMKNSNGEVLGEHAGIMNFTVGQRKGLNLPSGHSSGNPLYVLEIKSEEREVVVGPEEDLFSRALRADRVNWISIPELTEPIRVTIKVRHRHEPAAATLSPAQDGTVTALFDEPQRAITPGQSAVFYQEDEVVGGGWIY